MRMEVSKNRGKDVLWMETRRLRKLLKVFLKKKKESVQNISSTDGHTT